MAEKKAKEPKERKKRVTLRRKLRLRLTEYARTHMPLFRTLDDATWALSGAFVLAFLFWFHDHPNPWAIGLGLLILLFKLGMIVVNPNRKEKKKDEEL